jgi:hypothetical protein
VRRANPIRQHRRTSIAHHNRHASSITWGISESMYCLWEIAQVKVCKEFPSLASGEVGQDHALMRRSSLAHPSHPYLVAAYGTSTHLCYG